MSVRHWKTALLAVMACMALISPATTEPVNAQGSPRHTAPPHGASVRRPTGRIDRPGVFGRQLPRGYQEPAFSRGYGDGYEEGLNDGRRRDRYNPVGNRDYRSGDHGYYRTYGSRDAYKNNYRAGFRQGYEDGYRDAR